jgi:metal-responsive CopG/Arc/MetJ family transcriptional regulator
MAVFSINVPNEFLPTLDELVIQTGAGSRELWLRNTIGNMLIQYQVQKELGQQIQRRTLELSNLWR